MFLRDVPDDVRERIKSLDGTGLELFVADLLRPFETVGWKVWMTKVGGGDFGADLVLANPSGLKCAIQCKHRENPEKDEGLEAVQQVVASKAIYQVTYAIALTSAEDFTEKAKKLAAANGVLLWTRKQLELLYLASINRDEAVLADLGLIVPSRPKKETPKIELSLPTPVVEVPPPKQVEVVPPQPRRHSVVLWVGVVIVALAVLVFFIPQGTSSEQQIQAVVRGYDVAYRAALLTHATQPLLEYASSDLIDRHIQPFVNERIQRRCTLQTEELAPMRFERISVDGTRATVEVAKTWNQRLVCINADGIRIIRELPLGQFRVTYRLDREGGRWKISQSTGN